MSTFIPRKEAEGSQMAARWLCRLHILYYVLRPLNPGTNRFLIRWLIQESELHYHTAWRVDRALPSHSHWRLV